MPNANPNTVIAAQAAMRFRVLAAWGEFICGCYPSGQTKACSFLNAKKPFPWWRFHPNIGGSL
jgi:hypothetical protein